jgi:hypothetical protein
MANLTIILSMVVGGSERGVTLFLSFEAQLRRLKREMRWQYNDVRIGRVKIIRKEFCCQPAPAAIDCPTAADGAHPRWSPRGFGSCHNGQNGAGNL